MRRYVVTQLPDKSAWVILDRFLYGYCALPDGKGNLLPLEWKIRAAADAWLYKCRLVWGSGRAPAPEGWSGQAEAAQSPWAADYYNR